MKNNLLIVEDHELTRFGLKTTFDGVELIENVFEAENAEKAIDIVNNNKIDLIIMDLGLPNINGIEATKKIRLKNIGFIFQNFNLLPNLTALENVELPLQILGLAKDKLIRRAESLLRLTGLDHKANELPNSFSGGEQQRIAIARALANMPGLILADEPTGNLDLKSGKAVMEVIRSINENQQLTTIIVTHDPKIASYADKTYYLEDGRLIQTAL